MTKAEAETILRWDRESDAATLYTADPSEMRRWTKLGYPVEVCGVRPGRPGWQTRIPIRAIALLPLKAGRLQVSRWLEPPTVWDRAGKASGAEGQEEADEIPKEKRVEIPEAARTAV